MGRSCGPGPQNPAHTHSSKLLTSQALPHLCWPQMQFPGIGSTSPLLFLARRYAVLDGPGFPIVAEGDEEPNDTYVQQLTDSARAAVEELQRRGVADPSRIAVAGHSYGAALWGEVKWDAAAGLLAVGAVVVDGPMRPCPSLHAISPPPIHMHRCRISRRLHDGKG